MGIKFTEKKLRNYFKDKLLKKALAFVMLLFFNFNIFSEIIPDPASIGTKVTKTASGIDQIDIAAPNKNGTSYNSLKELQVSEQGLILNNNKHVAVNTQTAGLVARNRNLDNGVAANLIITEVTGKNRTNINGIVEVAGQRADLVMANRNGIYVNGGGFLNTDRVTLTTGSLQMKDGDLVAIDVSQGHIGIGEKGVDALSLTDLELLGKTIDIAGVIKASKETRVLVSAGGQTYEYRTKEVKSKGETYRGIAVDGKAAGSMYAGKIDIISNDKGAGVNTKGDLVSVDDITLTANGDITTNKVNAGKKVTYKSTKKVRMKGETTAGKKVQVKAKETEIDAKVVTGYLEKALGEKAIEIESEKTSITSKIEANGRVEIKSKETRNTGEILATEKIEVTGNKLNNNSGEIKSNSKIDINVKDTSNIKGYILSDGLTKEDVKKEEENKEQQNNENTKNKEIGINITGTLDNTQGVIRGREISIGGNIKGNSKGKIDSIGALTLNGKIIDNRNGIIKGNIKKLNADRLINDNGQLLSNEKIEGIIKETINIRGEISGAESVKIVGEKLNNLSGLIRSNGKIEVTGNKLNNNSGEIRSNSKIDINVKDTSNLKGYILSDGITKEDVKKEEENKEQQNNENIKNKEIGINITGTLDNTQGVIRGREISIGGNIKGNSKGKIDSIGALTLNGKIIDNRKGIIKGNIKRLNADRLINDNGQLLSNEKIEGIIKETSNIRGEISGAESVKIVGEKLNNLSGLIKSNGRIEVTGNKLNNNSGEIRSNGKIDINVKDTSNIKGYILSDGLTKEQAKEWQVEEKVKEESKEDKKEENKEQTTGINLKADRLDNTKGIIASLGKTAVNAGQTVNKDGKIVSRGVVELITPNEYVYEGTVAGDYATTLNAKKITVNEKMERKNTLELIAEQGVILKENIVSRILSIETKGNLDNAKEIKGTTTLVLKADNIENKGNLLSDKNLYIKANGKVLNTETGLIKGKEETYVEAGIIENNRGKILSEGNLALIAETLIRNDRGKLHARGDVYGEVRNGHFENIGETEVIIKDTLKATGTEGTAVTNFLRKRRERKEQPKQETERTYHINMNGSDITANGNVIIKAEKGDVTNKDGGNIEAGKGVSITAKNLYNTERYTTDGKDSVILAGGGRIKGSDVYIDVKGKVVNGTEEYEKGTNRRKDGVLVDNRNVTALNPSIIAGTNSTAIKGGNLVNTSQIGITGTTQIELTGKGINASIGNNIGKINGNIVLVEGNKGIRNIGGEIKGGEATQVTSKEGKVINESSITTKELTREVELGRFFKHIGKTVTEVYGITESIRNVGKIESNGTVYIEAKEAENIAGNIKGSEGTVIKSTEKDIVDRTIALREDKHGQVEVKEVTRPVRRGIGKISGDKVETVQVGTKWDSWTKTTTVSGEIGEGKNTILESARDIILESSNVKGKENIALNAKRYLTMLSTVDTEYKQRSETHKSGRVKKKTTTNNWVEDNVYANNVDLTSDGNILMNFRKVGAPADNKGVFAQGVNFNAKGGIIGLSDGNIYVQGTKDRLNSVFNSHTTKRFMGVRYGSGSDYVSDTREKYKLSQLYGEAGITYDAQGKLKVEGADIQTQGNVYLRGKQGVEILPGVENSIREEEHKTSGIKGSFGVSWSGISAGVGYGKSRDRISEITKEIIANRLEAAGDVEIKSEEGNVDIYPVNGYIGGKLTLTGKDINILDMQSERIIDRETESSYVGVGVNFGVPAISAAQQIWETVKGLTKARHKEDYINAGFGAFNAGMNAAGTLDGLFTNPIGMSGSINVSHNRSRYHREESISVGSNLRIGKGVEYNGNNLHTRGLNIINEGDTVYNITGKIIKEAGKSTIKETSGSRGYGLSLAKGMLDSNGNINVFKDGNLTATAGVSRQKGESESVYYSNNEDITKGKTTYNNNPEVKVIGVDVKTKEIEGSVKSLDIISVQDSVNGKSRGYSVNVGIGFGKHTNGEKVVNGPYISSVGAGYSKSDTTQKITRNVAEFSAESGILEVKDKVRQVGSLIDGGFTLNAKKYEHEDLEDINKSKSIGINVTVYPNVTYTVRDGKGKGVYTDGHTINGSGAVYKVGVSYAEVDKNREVVSTIGSNVKISQDMGDINRDVNNQVKEFEGKEVRGINVDLGTEYWLTEAGRGKTRDIIEGAGRTVKSIKKILTKTDSNGELEIVKNMEAESALRKMEQRGFVEGKDKKIERVAKEIETKYGNLTKKGIRVRFYGEEDIDTSSLTEAQLRKLKADGIATTGDGYIWINKEKIKDGNTINFNKVVSHEITHQILGEDSEYEARYIESGMEEFLSEIKGNGYLKDGKIIDLLYSRLTDEDRARLNRYILEDMQFKDMIGVDFRYEDKFNVNISKQNKLASEKELRKISKYEEVEKAALEAKRRGKKDKEIEKIYERGIDKIKEEEKYNKDRIINGKEKEFYEYVMKNSNLYAYRIETLAGNNGYYLVNESIGNEEMVPTEMPDSKVTLNEFRRNVLNGNIVYSAGILTTGYGITKEEAKRNREIKNGMLLNGLLQTGEGAVKATTGVSAIAGGATGCYYSGGMGCGIGLQMIGSGIVVGGMGINETYVGLQNIGYALSSGSGIGKGTAIEEYNRIRKEKGYIPANNVKINNPVLNYIVNKGGDEKDYQVISAATGAMATELNIYNNYYKKNSIVNYVEKERADREKNKGLKIVSKYNDINEYEYNVINPGPLEKLGQNSNFYGGRYNIEVLKVDKIFYRGGDSKGSPLGQYFTETPPESIIKVRIDSAVKPYWITPEGHYNGKSPINTVYVVKIPAGTTIYKGPVGYQEGVYLGGLRTEQIFIEKPWNLKEIEVINHYPLR